jgi:aminoglycoside phosphotransferase (APT) family kinase protein
VIVRAHDLAEFDDVARALGTRLVRSAAIGWGDARATDRLDLVDGRRVAVRRHAGPEIARSDRTAGIMTRAAASGLPVPDPILLHTAAATWLVTPWVDGPLGSSWLDTPARARALAGSMSSLWRQVVALAPAVIVDPAAPPDSDPDESGVVDGLDPSTRDVVDAAFGTIAGRQTEARTFVHGDFAPINVVLDADGTIRALLDFEHAHVGSRLEDVAWWSWVVRYHHPDAWAEAWPAFCDSAEVDPVADAVLVEALAMSELVRRASAAPDDRSRDRWLERIARTARFS